MTIGTAFKKLLIFSQSWISITVDLAGDLVAGLVFKVFNPQAK